MFGRRIFLLGAAYFMVGFTRPSGAAESRTLVAFLADFLKCLLAPTLLLMLRRLQETWRRQQKRSER